LKEHSNNEYSYQQALLKAERYCAYQERCTSEVLGKLEELHVSDEYMKNILECLYENDFLNEERFAKSFVRGKFRIKHWGRIKIKQELKKKRIADTIIKSAMQEIDAEHYIQILKDIATKKNKEIKDSNKLLRKQKLLRFLNSKGFEQDLIFDILKTI
jgi:regulatory protein